MTWGIIGAMDAEVALLRQNMQVEREISDYGTTFYLGTLQGQRVVVACSGVGTINAALCASLMIRELGAQCIVNTGIAGGMDDRLGVLDVVISKTATFHDADPVIGEFYPFLQEFEADKELIALAERAVAALPVPPRNVLVGRVASGDLFVTETARKEEIRRRMPSLCVEMEGAAIAQAAYMNHVPFLILRTISDTADDRLAMTYEEFKPRAADQSAAAVMGMLALSGEKV